MLKRLANNNVSSTLSTISSRHEAKESKRVSIEKHQPGRNLTNGRACRWAVSFGLEKNTRSIEA